MTQEALQVEHPKGGNEQHGPEVNFEHIASLQEVKFHADWNDTLQHTWDRAYEKLGEAHRADDRLQTAEGVDVMPYLGMTLRQLHDDKALKSRKFQIVGPTGGA